MPAKQTITVSFSWDGQKQAQVYYVIDNGVVRVDAADDKSGRGAIAVTYDAVTSAAHLIKWSLWFPGKTLKNLSAVASADGGDDGESARSAARSTPDVNLDSSGSEDDHWVSEGTWKP